MLGKERYLCMAERMENGLKGKHIILGVTGSIAAVKAPMIARELMRQGAAVTVAMTSSAQQFVTPTALSVLTRTEVITEIFPKSKEAAADAGTWHIHLARSADAMLIAPCSASTIGKLRVGIYDNAVTLLASSLLPSTPLILHPAMDEEMWMQWTVQENLSVLTQHGVKIIQPTEGALASGLVGKGRMKEPIEIVQEFVAVLQQRATTSSEIPTLKQKKVLITGGPTYEPIDAVRFIGNRSSGKMAAALANAASAAGAEVTLIMGPSHQQTDSSVKRIDVETAEEMGAAVNTYDAASDIIIMSAAVSDFAAAEPSTKKLKKREILDKNNELSLTLRRTPDILRGIAARKHHGQILVGFALELGDEAERYALGKLEEKGLDMIVLNRADESGSGFSHDTNKITLYFRDGRREEFPLLSKQECAAIILARAAALSAAL